MLLPAVICFPEMWSVATPQKNGAFGQKERLRVSRRSRQGKKKAGQLSEGQKQQTQKGMGAKAGRMNFSEANAILCGPGLTLSV